MIPANTAKKALNTKGAPGKIMREELSVKKEKRPVMIAGPSIEVIPVILPSIPPLPERFSPCLRGGRGGGRGVRRGRGS